MKNMKLKKKNSILLPVSSQEEIVLLSVERQFCSLSGALKSPSLGNLFKFSFSFCPTNPFKLDVELLLVNSA